MKQWTVEEMLKVLTRSSAEHALLRTGAVEALRTMLNVFTLDLLRDAVELLEAEVEAAAADRARGES